MQNITPLALRACALLTFITLGACNSEGSSSTTSEQSFTPIAATDAQPISSVNIAPTIAGSPSTTAVIGASYSFTPSAADVNSDALTFSIQNQPAWATFNPATGQLVGTPNAASVSPNVLISVSDGKTTTRLTAFSITVPTSGGLALVSWSPPVDNTDGSALRDLAGYYIYFGTDPAQLARVNVSNPNTLTYTAANLPSGTYYFTVTAYNSAGMESAQPSPVVSAVVG